MIVKKETYVWIDWAYSIRSYQNKEEETVFVVECLSEMKSIIFYKEEEAHLALLLKRMDTKHIILNHNSKLVQVEKIVGAFFPNLPFLSCNF